MAFGISAYTDRNDEIIYDYVPYNLCKTIKFYGSGYGAYTLPSLPSGKKYIVIAGMVDSVVDVSIKMNGSQSNYSQVQYIRMSGNTVQINTLTTPAELALRKDFYVSIFVVEA